MGRLILVALLAALITAAVGWYIVHTQGYPIVKSDETETTRDIKRFFLRMVLMLAGTALGLWCLFMLRAAWDLVT